MKCMAEMYADHQYFVNQQDRARIENLFIQMDVHRTQQEERVTFKDGSTYRATWDDVNGESMTVQERDGPVKAYTAPREWLEAMADKHGGSFA